MELIIVSLFLGVGLAMDACCVSMANGLKEPKMKVYKVLIIALSFGIFQGLMPLIGYLVGHAFISFIEPLIPWFALVLLGILGVKMIIDGIKGEEEVDERGLTLKVLFVQAIATSIDALSVGFTIADYSIIDAVICTSIITIVTAVICFFAVYIGKKFGTKLGGKATILGGIILLAIGLEIFITGMFF